MMIEFGRILVALAIAALPFVAPASARADQTFRIHDRVSSDEVEEVTTLIVDGRTVRSFHLDKDDHEIVIDVTVGVAESHEFGLCGHILVRTADGLSIRRAFDISGLLYDVADRDFEAVASDGYTHFYLVDTTKDTNRAPARIEPLPGHACTPAVSLRGPGRRFG